MGAEVGPNHEDGRTRLAAAVDSRPSKAVDKDQVTGRSGTVLEDRDPAARVACQQLVFGARVLVERPNRWKCLRHSIAIVDYGPVGDEQA